jgi:hypothetical protein
MTRMLSLNARARVPNKQVQATLDSAPDLAPFAEYYRLTIRT